MRTGYDLIGTDLFYLDNETQAVVLAIIHKVMETAIMYTEKSKRNTVTVMDVKYAFRYQAHVFFYSDTLEEDVQRYLGTESETESCDSSTEEECEDFVEDEFQRCETDPFCQRVNALYDGWDDWNPSDIMQQRVKNAIDLISV